MARVEPARGGASVGSGAAGRGRQGRMCGRRLSRTLASTDASDRCGSAVTSSRSRALAGNRSSRGMFSSVPSSSMRTRALAELDAPMMTPARYAASARTGWRTHTCGGALGSRLRASGLRDGRGAHACRQRVRAAQARPRRPRHPRRTCSAAQMQPISALRLLTAADRPASTADGPPSGARCASPATGALPYCLGLTLARRFFTANSDLARAAD